MNSRAQIFKALKINSAGTLIRYLANFVLLIAIARALGPDNFATVSLALVLITILKPLSDFGTHSAIIHFRRINPIEKSSIFVFNLLSSFVCIAIFYAVQSLFGGHLPRGDNPALLLILISAQFLFYSVGQYFSAFSEKALNFTVVAKAEAGASIVSLLISLAFLSIIEPSPIVIGISVFTQSLSRTMLLVVHSKLKFPKLRFSQTAIRKYLNFSIQSILANGVNSLNSNADLLVGARYLSSEKYGLFSLPRDIGIKVSNAFIIPIITRVTQPVIANQQNNKYLAKDNYLLTIFLISNICFPLYGLLFCLSDEIINTLLGSRWHDSAYVLQLMCVWGLIRSIFNPVGNLCNALGRPSKILIWHCSAAIPSFILYVYATNFGMIGLATSNIITALLAVIATWGFIVNRLIGTDFKDLFLQTSPAFISTVISTLSSYAVVMLVHEEANSVLASATACIVFSATYICLTLLFNQRLTRLVLTFFQNLIK